MNREVFVEHEHGTIIKKGVNSNDLIVVDLDGTILPDFKHLDKEITMVLRELKKRGHKICIATGRNYLSSLSIYNEIGLDDIIITYNGALINNPNDSKYMACFEISNSIIHKILSADIINRNLLNLMVDYVKINDNGKIKTITISTSDDKYYQEVFYNGWGFKKENNYQEVLSSLGNNNCLQLVLEFENDEKKINKIISFLKKFFKNSIEFYYGEKLKEDVDNNSLSDKEKHILIVDEKYVIFKIRSINASKGKAVKIVAGFNNINMKDCIAFGNDVNDIDMINIVGEGVVMSDGNWAVKPFAAHITEKSSKEGGVSHYLRNFYGIK